MTCPLDLPLELWTLILQELPLLALSLLFEALADVPLYIDISTVTEMQAGKVLYTLLLTSSPSIDVWIRSNGHHINHSQDSVYKEYVESVANSTESGTSSDRIHPEPPCFCNKRRFRCFLPDIKETKFHKSFNRISTSQFALTLSSTDLVKKCLQHYIPILYGAEPANLFHAAIYLSSESKYHDTLELHYGEIVARQGNVVQDTFYSCSVRDRKISCDLQFKYAIWIGQDRSEKHPLPASWFQRLGEGIDASVTLRKSCYDDTGRGEPPSLEDWVEAQSYMRSISVVLRSIRLPTCSSQLRLIPGIISEPETSPDDQQSSPSTR